MEIFVVEKFSSDLPQDHVTFGVFSTKEKALASIPKQHDNQVQFKLLTFTIDEFGYENEIDLEEGE